MAVAYSLDEIQGQFQDQGYVILRGFLEPEVVDTLRTTLDGLVDRFAEKLVAEGKIPSLYKDEPFETRWKKIWEGREGDAPNLIRPELHLEGMYSLFSHPRLLDVLELLLGPEIRIYPNYSARPKLPRQDKTLVLWHQDGGYTDGQTDKAEISVNDLKMVNVWTPLVPAGVKEGCMQFIPGTQKLGFVPHESRQYFLEINRADLDSRISQAVDVEMVPGDVVLFHNLLFHQGLPNVSDIVRWNVDWRYQDATQPTLRKEQGHLVRSRQHPDQVVKSAQDWASRKFE